MREVIAALIIVLLIWCTGACPQEKVTASQGKSISTKEPVDSTREDDRLPIYKEGWQVFLAPYLWVPGAHLDIGHRGRFSGTTVADVPWYNLVPLLFSKVMGGMGRVEIWNGKWGLISDTNFI
jgi:hypothetical protein